MTRTREENAEDLAFEEDSAKRECRAALGQLLDQVYQMQGMFPDDAELELAIQDAEQALEGTKHMKFIPVTDDTFDRIVTKSSFPVLVYFWASWCGPCKQVGPTLEQISEELDGEIKIVKIDVDNNPGVTNSLGVRGLPSMFIFIDGDIVANRSGSASKQDLKSWIQDSI